MATVAVISELPIYPVTVHGRQRFRLDLRGIGGKRLTFTTKRAAENERLERLAALDNGGTEAALLSPGERGLFLHARTELAKVGATISDAVKFYLVNGHRALSVRTVADAATECKAAKKSAGKRPRYLEVFGYALDHFSRAFGSRKVSDVTGGEIEAWLHAQETWSLSTRKRRLIDLGTFFGWCVRRNYSGRNPVPDVERIRTDETKPEILQPAQVEKLLSTVRKKFPAFLPYFTLALFSGARRSEITGSTWGNVDLKRKILTVDPEVAKKRRRRIVALSSNCVEWLRLGGDLPPLDLNHSLTGIYRAAGIAHWPHNALRHSFCSYHLAAHENAALTAMQAGHSERVLFSRYRELVTREEAAKFWAILPHVNTPPAEEKPVLGQMRGKKAGGR